MNLFTTMKSNTSIVFFPLLLIAFNFFISCKCQTENAAEIENTIDVPKGDFEFQKNISTVLKDYFTQLTVTKTDSIKYVSWQQPAKDLYAKNSYQALWVSKDVLSAKGKEMLHFVGTVEYLGLNKDLYEYEKLQQLSDSLTKILPNVDFNLSKQLEAGLTRSFLQIALHIDHGMFIDTSKGISSNFWNYKEKYISLLEKTSTDSISTLISSLEPSNPMYRRYMVALRDFVSKNNISENHIFVRNPKLDSIGAVNDARKALVYHHYLVDSLKNNNDAFLVAMKSFQKDNNLKDDGTIGLNTIKALERDNSKKFQLLAINADRWRKERILELPDKYVWVNLPSYKLKIIENDTLRLEKKVVIGKSNKKNETPILESAINQIVLWPTWSVPQSIIKHEMKSFRGYKVSKNGSYTSVVQPPGPRNALGCVKILFPNKYSVYIHDTPSKATFGADLRAASHGCVRCQDPLEVAANLMMMDTFLITYDSLKILKENRIATRTFRLKKPIPVYFRYFTAEADFDGNLKFYADVYGRDKQMINFIFKGKKPHVFTKEELREKQMMDSIAIVKKKKEDSLLVITKAKEALRKKDSQAVQTAIDSASLRN